ncbi:uncharacterized protein MONOS_13932 [Monocercomonoides exilis]|uniref:uncharacterized protein n=1 Tax=Monocercomonoides exilis TaxID=2049356 RepID=UPI00355A9F1B|nr:hypothetical protein MONOS_13932 [Monocercomonoides exilis]|eukprot:MONOS_13932.1-p1 / transcript=MONOS_13932.1 / gene=MONOS_13932 / organism=Monocercomonoides_exilis_PA203 / gene_product=unspecified product / transcript_product=unspecified product / location=Mono_scaffold00906:8292-9065(+) / protein_length=258 / sequence_SO=supercontig / SO=protein_coding / is_pseudo=false
MGPALPSFLGRYRTASSRPKQASDSNERDNRMAWKAWTVSQLRQEQISAETDIQLFRMNVEDEEMYSQPGTRGMHLFEEGVQTVDETCKEKRGSQDQELCIVRRSHMRHMVRHERCIASNEQVIPCTQQSCDEGRMECEDESQPLDYQENIWMEEKTNQEGTKAMNIIRSIPVGPFYGFGTSGLWSHAEDQRKLVPLSPTFQKGLFQPNLQLQGDVGYLDEPQVLPPAHPWAPHSHSLAKIRQHESSLRHQSLDSGS